MSKLHEAIYRAACKRGLNAEKFDILSDATHDILSEAGFWACLVLVLRLEENALLSTGPLCSSWLAFLSAYNHKRTKKDSIGLLSNDKVVEGNIMNENVAILCCIAASRRVYMILENPMGSHYFQYDTTRTLCQLLGLIKINTWMRSFGHWCPKPTWLIGQSFVKELKRVWSAKEEERQRQEFRKALRKVRWLFRLCKSRGFQFAKRSWDKRRKVKTTSRSATGAVTGKALELKRSGAYPICYACCLLDAWGTHALDHGFESLDLSLSELLQFLPFPTSSILQAAQGHEDRELFREPEGLSEAIAALKDNRAP